MYPGRDANISMQMVFRFARISMSIMGFAVFALHCNSVVAQRGLLDDDPEPPRSRETPARERERRDVPDVRREVPDVRKEIPRKAEPEKMRVPTTIAELYGCWQSESGEIPIVSNRNRNEHWGTARYCYCFERDGRGLTRVVFTSVTRVVSSRGPMLCQGGLSASLQGGSLTFHHGKLPCTDRSRWLDPAVWLCSAAATRATVCALQPPWGPRDEQFVRVDDLLAVR